MGAAPTGKDGLIIMKVWADANVVLRFLLRDNEDLYAKAAAVMDRAERGQQS